MAAVPTACLLPPSPGVAKSSENLPKGDGGHKDLSFFPGHSLESFFLHHAEGQADYTEIIKQSQIRWFYLIAVPGFS